MMNSRCNVGFRTLEITRPTKNPNLNIYCELCLLLVPQFGDIYLISCYYKFRLRGVLLEKCIKYYVRSYNIVTTSGNVFL